VDDADYEALRDDYTARAAAVLRAIEAGRKRFARRGPRTDRRRGVLIAVAVLVFAGVAGALVAQAVGRREVGEVISGDIDQSQTEKLNEAGRRSAEGDYDAAIALYDEVLEVEPDNAEAMTYRGWLLTLDDQEADGLEALLAAATAHPSYPDVHAFLAIVFFRNRLVEQASRELDRLEGLDPPVAIRDLTASLRDQIDAALAQTGSTTTAPPAVAPTDPAPASG
jgi:tetratricopeptide (TPR) repeat protein